ncbi:SusC/RagA family TonB-linked outer membrane protein [Chitinophaga silvatica]|uniref:SusC/RagA family TonB-linked outer membrane protein n=1 Tax=Chitinophaga silvatica TaxID=2282649 RepID=A0A3E1Y3Q2_9BACT|nr:SusC/RagA family TonB-linked outer membrane protein [Chitinophaga silvatica]RFS19315.1 SusC/RagA family TonB-linked outer membrane protein [Chitinophaga silvatica]
MNFLSTKPLSVMRMTAILLLATALQVSASTSAQEVNLSVRKMPLEKVFTALGKQTGYAFFWDQQQINAIQPVSVNLHNVSLKVALNTCLSGVPLTYELIEAGKTVFIRRRSVESAPEAPIQQLITVSGHVGGESGPLNGVSIIVKGTRKGTSSDDRGEFILRDVDPRAVLVFSMIGFQEQEVSVQGKTSLRVFMKVKTQQVNEVLVTTGIFTRRKESFTGDAATYTGEQLNRVGNQNVLQSLKSLDPAFIVIDNNIAGSNPNVMPNMMLQGKSSIIGTTDKYSTDPNQPLFILDGFATTVDRIIGLDMNRVASVTVLKDAASTAIYGSRAANGVIVIETKQPVAGRMNVSATFDNTTSFADLRDYNMMNAAEKLEFERLANAFTKSLDNAPTYYQLNERYTKHLNDVLGGVDTYWMGYPIHKSVLANSYSVQASGGDTRFRYGLGGKYRDEPGVMIGSERKSIGANVDLTYRTSKFNFSNRIYMDTYKAKESPYGSFKDFVNTIPYYKPTNDEFLEVKSDLYSGQDVLVWNPLFQAKLPKKDETRNFNITNQIQSYYMITDQFKVEAKLNLGYSTSEHEIYKSPRMKEFAQKEFTAKGLYSNDHSRNFNYEGYLQASYGKTWESGHEMNFVPGFNFDGSKIIGNVYSAVGFPEVDQISPSFANGYPIGGTPEYSSVQKRSVSGFLNAYYGYKRKYMVDFDYRRDGSSIFGSNRRFTDTWTFGAAWNLHNENFIKSQSWISFLKLRASIGNPGNQSFGSYNSFTTYGYNKGALNSYGMGMLALAWGNPDLDWQKTLKKTIGLDTRLLHERISLVVNVYDNVTDPLIVDIGAAPSTGSTQRMFNIGNSTTKGFDFTISGVVVQNERDRFYVRLNLMGKRESTVYGGLGNALDALNRKNQNVFDTKGANHDYSQISLNLQRYLDGGHPDDLWAVQSMGIDPGTGRELFLSKDGQLTYNYDVANIVKVGNSMPLMQGVGGISVQYKGFNMNMGLRYMLQSQQFNNGAFSKVENLTRDQVYNQNLDKRALYEKWKRVGGVAQFSKIPDLTYASGSGANWDAVRMSSRFIQEENTLSGETFSAGYNFYQSAFLKKLSLQGLNLTAYMNDIFRISNIKRERGIDYPYARSFSFKVNATF